VELRDLIYQGMLQRPLVSAHKTGPQDRSRAMERRMPGVAAE